MKAFTYSTKAGEMAWHDGDFKIPKPGRSQVQVKVLAVGMNPIDYKLPHMVPFSSRVLRNRLVGFDFSGEVTIPNGEFKVGDVVFGVTMKGSLGEYTIVDTNRIARVPEGMEYTTAAGLASSACTALTGLRKADITKSPGNVLIIGASGGVGCMAVQLAKSFGAKVWAVCSDKNEKLVTSLGADQVLDYTKPGFTFPNELCPADSIDVVFDTVSSPEDMNYEVLVRKSLKSGGKYIATNSPRGFDVFRAILSSFLPFDLQRSGFHMVTADVCGEDLKTLAGMVVKGELKMPIDEVLPFTEEGCRKALEMLRSRRVRGKVVIDMMK